MVLSPGVGAAIDPTSGLFPFQFHGQSPRFSRALCHPRAVGSSGIPADHCDGLTQRPMGRGSCTGYFKEAGGLIPVVDDFSFRALRALLSRDVKLDVRFPAGPVQLIQEFQIFCIGDREGTDYESIDPDAHLRETVGGFRVTTDPGPSRRYVAILGAQHAFWKKGNYLESSLGVTEWIG